MALETQHRRLRCNQQNPTFLSHLNLNLFSLLCKTTPSPSPPSVAFSAPPPILVPLLFADAPVPIRPDPTSSRTSPSMVGKGASSETASGFPSTVRIGGLNSDRKGGGPAFVGQVFSMCDISGTGLMAVTTHFDIPFISKRIPEWMKKMFAGINKSNKNGPVFRFFMDLGDAVSYVRRLNIPSGVVGACRLDLAYEHFKEKPHLFQFVPNQKQVKAANELLKRLPQNGGKQKVDGVPVFSAQNLDIAIATTDGIKWYTPYFFDKNMLDNILEESVDQHFHSLIQNRHLHRRRDVIDDNLTTEVVEENGDSIWEPPEVQELLDEMGHPAIPLSVISKAAEMQLLYAVDKVLLGNRWLRKATGIQPKFPYMVDSFEKRSAASFLKASESTSCITSLETDGGYKDPRHPGPFESNLRDSNSVDHPVSDFRFPFGDWSKFPWSKRQLQSHITPKTRMDNLVEECIKQEIQPNPLLPKITMVGISTGEAGQMTKASLKKIMEDLTKELEESNQGNGSAANASGVSGLSSDDRDPLFVANVGDYYAGMGKTGSARWVRGRSS
ncbi:Tic22-like [Dillenia turbinata]|uniref:Tic22-like n=1 Tax=Dillenia turbinata TaxID=194707 RepID=A0AAN8V3A6_9MAGN